MDQETDLKYLFQLIVNSSPDFNCCNKYELYWVNNVTIGTQEIVFVISYVAAPVEVEIIQLADQVRIRLITQ